MGDPSEKGVVVAAIFAAAIVVCIALGVVQPDEVEQLAEAIEVEQPVEPIEVYTRCFSGPREIYAGLVMWDGEIFVDDDAELWGAVEVFGAACVVFHLVDRPVWPDDVDGFGGPS